MTIIIDTNGNVPALPEPNYSAGGMSFLQMVQRLRQESGTSGAAPSTTVNQSGDIKNLVDWISSAWMDIQTERADWFFMRQPVSFNTVAGQSSYTAAQAGLASFGNYKRDSFRQYLVAGGVASEMDLPYLAYDRFRDAHLFGSERTRTQLPLHFTIDPQKNFLIGPIPDAVYNINGEGYALPTEFALDADRPTLPSQFHMLIVWRALIYYGYKEAAPEALTFGENEHKRIMRQLMRDQLPDVTVAGALC